MRSRTAPAGATVRSWRGEPRHVVGALVAILAASAVLPLWNLGRSGDFDFYAAAVRSMSTSWRAFAFGSFDPGAAVTLDKLSGFLVPQALSARLFGFSWSALALPQVLEGVVTVYCCATVALRLAGARAGLFAGCAMASTPIAVAMFGHSMEDGMLTAALAVALLWWQRAATTGTIWPLAVAGLAVGVGFQAKMLQAWFVLPALVLALPLALGLRRALPRAAVLVGVAVVASLAWMTAMQLVPGHPWFDGSVRDDVFAMVFRFNGVDRLLPLPAREGLGAPPLVLDESRLVHATVLSNPAPAQLSPLKLLLPYYTTQVGWLYPLALAGLVLAARRVLGRDARRSGPDPARAVVAALAVWLVTAAAVLTKASLAHTAYVAAIAVQLAVLAAAALEEGFRARERGGAGRLLLPGLLVVQGLWSALLVVQGAMPLPLVALSGVLLAAGVVGVVAWVAPVARLRAAVPVLVTAGLLAGAVGWSLQALDASRAGTPADAYVGPKTQLAGDGPVAPWHPSRPDLLGGQPAFDPRLAAAVARITGGRRGADAPVFAIDSERVAAPVVESTGLEGLTDGGYSGAVPVLTVQHLETLRAQHRLSWLLTFGRPPEPNAVDRFARGGHCRVVERWSADPSSKVLAHGLAVWHCP